MHSNNSTFNKDKPRDGRICWMREQPSKLQHQTKIHPHRFHSVDSKITNLWLKHRKHEKLSNVFIADGTARMTESSSSMVTDAAGTDDQSGEDSGKFMH